MKDNSEYKPKPGDKVIITKSYNNWCSPQMDKFIGKIYTISDIMEYKSATFVEEDEEEGLSDWSWVYEDGHFEILSKENKKILKIKLKF